MTTLKFNGTDMRGPLDVLIDAVKHRIKYPPYRSDTYSFRHNVDKDEGNWRLS